MTDKNGFCPGGHAFEEIADQFFFGVDGQADGAADIGCTFLLAIVAPGPVEGFVFQVGAKDLVSGGQGKAPGDGIDGMGGIGEVDDVIGVAMNIVAQRLPGSFEVARAFYGYKLNGFIFQFPLPALVIFENGEGAGAERTEVEIGDRGVEQELGLQGREWHGLKVINFSGCVPGGRLRFQKIDLPFRG